MKNEAVGMVVTWGIQVAHPSSPTSLTGGGHEDNSLDH